MLPTVPSPGENLPAIEQRAQYVVGTKIVRVQIPCSGLTKDPSDALQDDRLALTDEQSAAAAVALAQRVVKRVGSRSLAKGSDFPGRFPSHPGMGRLVIHRFV